MSPLQSCAACAQDFADDFTDLKLVIDGQPVSNLNSLRVQAESTFTSVSGNVFILLFRRSPTVNSRQMGTGR